MLSAVQLCALWQKHYEGAVSSPCIYAALLSIPASYTLLLLYVAAGPHTPICLCVNPAVSLHIPEQHMQISATGHSLPTPFTSMHSVFIITLISTTPSGVWPKTWSRAAVTVGTLWFEICLTLRYCKAKVYVRLYLLYLKLKGRYINLVNQSTIICLVGVYWLVIVNFCLFVDFWGGGF